MAAKKRRTRTSVKQTLWQDASGFNFFKAVHLLEGAGRQRPLDRDQSPGKDPVRFCVKPGFAFPASDIQAIQTSPPGSPPVMQVNFMGLIGPAGVLPNWYNAHAQALNHKKDFALTDFLDLFHHRLIALFYLAWKKYRLPENYHPDGLDPITQSLNSFIGMDDQAPDAKPDFDRTTKRRLLYFTGLAARNVPTAAAIETIVASTTGVPVRVKQFVEQMLAIHEQDRTRLGRANSTLQKDALCGGRVRDIASFFQVTLGPMSWKKYLAFQPRSRNLALVRKLITFIVGLEYEFEIRLILKGPQIPSLALGGGKTGAPILGRTVLLKRPEKAYPKNIEIKQTKKFTDT